MSRRPTRAVLVAATALALALGTGGSPAFADEEKWPKTVGADVPPVVVEADQESAPREKWPK